jgi:hypothetical protein
MKSQQSGYSCPGEPWIIDNNDKDFIFNYFQQWLYKWQYDCNEKSNYEGLSVGMGIGSSILGSSNWFEFALEQGKFYRPNYEWEWADKNSSTCTFSGIPSLDCYFKPLTQCGINNSYIDKESLNSNSIDLSLIPEMQNIKSIDSCIIAKNLKKSLQFIHGNIIHYIIRQNKDLEELINIKRNEIFKIKSNISSNIIVGVHIRGGNPDSGRIVLHISHYIRVIDDLNFALKLENKSIVAVYMCSDLPEYTFISVEYLTKTYPRSYKYLTIPPERGSITRLKEQESEHFANNNPHEKRKLATEFFMDIDILSNTDIFIGSQSNIYVLVSALRIARNINKINNFYNHSCFLRSEHASKPPDLNCERSYQVTELWKHLSRGGYSGSNLAQFESINQTIK